MHVLMVRRTQRNYILRSIIVVVLIDMMNRYYFIFPTDKAFLAVSLPTDVRILVRLPVRMIRSRSEMAVRT